MVSARTVYEAQQRLFFLKANGCPRGRLRKAYAKAKVRYLDLARRYAACASDRSYSHEETTENERYWQDVDRTKQVKAMSEARSRKAMQRVWKGTVGNNGIHTDRQTQAHRMCPYVSAVERDDRTNTSLSADGGTEFIVFNH